MMCCLKTNMTSTYRRDAQISTVTISSSRTIAKLEPCMCILTLIHLIAVEQWHLTFTRTCYDG